MDVPPYRAAPMFQSTLPRGERPPLRMVPTTEHAVSIPRSRAGSDAPEPSRQSDMKCFNPRSRAGSDVRLSSSRRFQTQFQSTLPRGERPPLRMVPTTEHAVSIHAPARGATAIFYLKTQAGWFQSTLPRGERPRCHETARQNAAVSIHAPARGATRASGRWKHSSRCFNPRSRAGSDHTDVLESCFMEGFQSPLPRGERHLLP